MTDRNQVRSPLAMVVLALLVEAPMHAYRTRSKGLPRLFLLEDEYQQAMMRAEIDWLTSVIADLRSKKITWSKEWIRKVAEAAERDPAV